LIKNLAAATALIEKTRKRPRPPSSPPPPLVETEKTVADRPSMPLNNKKCESCRTTAASYGLLTDGKRRWCAPCGRKQEGAEDVINKRCESCHTKRASYGLLTDGKCRWCGPCGRKQEGAEDV
jgi:hypothetical protein